MLSKEAERLANKRDMSDEEAKRELGDNGKVSVYSANSLNLSEPTDELREENVLFVHWALFGGFDPTVPFPPAAAAPCTHLTALKNRDPLCGNAGTVCRPMLASAFAAGNNSARSS